MIRLEPQADYLTFREITDLLTKHRLKELSVEVPQSHVGLLIELLSARQDKYSIQPGYIAWRGVRFYVEENK